jgi:putative intracellular protease/amidase
MTRALVLRHHKEDHSGLIGEALESRGYEIDLRMMNESSVTPSLDGYDIFVILGSKSAVYDKEVEAAWFGREMELIAEAGRRDLPIFGICFGAQALCLYHGGVVERSTNRRLVGTRSRPSTVRAVASGPWFEFHFDLQVARRAPSCGRPLRDRCRPSRGKERRRAVPSRGRSRATRGLVRRWRRGGPRLRSRHRRAGRAETRRETPAARERAAELVDLFLSHIEA